MASNKIIETVTGTNDYFKFTLTNKDNGNAIPLDGAEITFSVKKLINDAAYTFQRHNTAAGGGDTEIDFLPIAMGGTGDGTDGKIIVYTVPANTSGKDPGEYVYDLYITDSSSSIDIPIIDVFRIKKSVTVITPP